jgi:hypothetical protein
MSNNNAVNDVSTVEPGSSSVDSQKVVWDSSKMNTSYSNVCNVLGSREEITLLFGANQAWHPGQKEVKVLLSERVVLNPYAAKRLSTLLDKVLKEYEARFGELKSER